MLQQTRYVIFLSNSSAMLYYGVTKRNFNNKITSQYDVDELKMPKHSNNKLLISKKCVRKLNRFIFFTTNLNKI